MALVTLLMLALLMVLLNASHYLREYRATRLPGLGTLVLLLTAPLVLLDHRLSDFWLRLVWLLLLAVGGLASFIDWEHHLLPDRLILPTVILSILLIAMTHDPRPALIGALSWFAIFAVLAMINPNGLGWGDVKFAVLLGADCGAIDLKLVTLAICLAAATGGSYALYVITKGNRRSQIPFGPFMFAGALAALLGA